MTIEQIFEKDFLGKAVKLCKAGNAVLSKSRVVDIQGSEPSRQQICWTSNDCCKYSGKEVSYISFDEKTNNPYIKFKRLCNYKGGQDGK